MRRPLILAALVAGLVFFHRAAHRVYKNPYPSTALLLTEQGGLQDVLFVVGGFRSLGADFAWVQLLQYAGKPLLKSDTSPKKYPLLKDLTLRVTHIDPYFKGAYIFGAALLAYLQPVQRFDEASDVLREGISYNPEYWMLHRYALGISYRQKNDFTKMWSALREAVQQPDAPALVRALFANTLKQNGQYVEALEIWHGLLTSSDGEYRARAERQISEITALLASPKKSPR